MLTENRLSGLSLQEMQSTMGADSGMWVWEIIRGVDVSEGASARAVLSASPDSFALQSKPRRKSRAC